LSNPFSGIITSDFKEIFTNMIDALLEDEALTVPCRLIYEGTKFTLCPNCIVSPITGRSAGLYNGSGPHSFTTGSCPVCNGVGRINDQQTEDLYLCVLWNYKDWIGDIAVNTPDGYVQTISKIDTLDSIKRANKILINTDLQTYVKHYFTRSGEPTPVGLGSDAYIFTMWRKSS